MKIIVFDKDGVLIDSVDEIFHESVIAYKEFGKVEFKKINIEKFKKLYPFAKKAEDIYAVMKMIEDKNTRLNRLVKTNEKDAEKFKRKFYNARKYAMKNYYTKWIKNIKPFYFAIETLTKISKEYGVFISTSSDMKSTLEQFKNFGVEIEKKFIFSKELSPDKEKHFQYMEKAFKVKLEDVLFIDNNIEQLKSMMQFKVKVALASWGSNSYQIVWAKKSRIPILKEKNLYKAIKEIME